MSESLAPAPPMHGASHHPQKGPGLGHSPSTALVRVLGSPHVRRRLGTGQHPVF